MNLLKYIPFQLILFQILGIVIGYFFPFTTKVATTLLVISLVIILIAYQSQRNPLQRNYLYFFATFLLFISIGISTITFSNDLNKKHHYSSYITNNENKAVLIIKEVLKPNTYYNNYGDLASIPFHTTKLRLFVSVLDLFRSDLLLKYTFVF